MMGTKVRIQKDASRLLAFQVDKGKLVSVAKALPRQGTGARAAGGDLQHGRGDSARVSQFSRDAGT